MGAHVASFYDGLIVLTFFGRTVDSAVLHTLSRVVVPPLTVAIIRVSVPRCFRSNAGLVEPHASMSAQPYFIAKALITTYLLHNKRQHYTFCRHLNLLTKLQIIRRGAAITIIEVAESISSLQRTSVSNIEQKPQMSTEDKLKKISDLGLSINCEHLTDDVFERLCDLLYRYSDIFATKLADLTGSNIIQCHIETEDHPFRIKPYRLTPPMRKDLDKQIDGMMQAGIIQESDNSPLASPVMMVKKLMANIVFA